jgi:uncharacterized protein YjbI with pentapeptide repeats
MFPLEVCPVPGCGNLKAFGQPTCLLHSPQRAGLEREIRSFLSSHDPLADLALPHLELEGLDLSRKRIYFCCFSRARLRRVRFDECHIRLLFLVFADLEECSFAKVQAHCLVFGGARISSCSFTDAELLRSNFIGMQGRQLSFDGSDLYTSRFTGSTLEGVSFRDCNLKRARFERCTLSSVDFRSSNTEEAFFE